MALGLLGQLSCEELVRAIVQGDLRQLCQAPGVGKRTAERLSVELRTRLQQRYGESLQLSQSDDLQVSDSGEGPAAGVREEVQLTLSALGYEALEINRALRAISPQGPELGEDGDAWLRESLRYLSRDVA